MVLSLDVIYRRELGFGVFYGETMYFSFRTVELEPNQGAIELEAILRTKP